MLDDFEQLQVDPLTSRELEILRHIADGSSDREIAEALFLSLHTIKWYNRQIYMKLGVGSRTQAVALASLKGLLEVQPTPLDTAVVERRHNLPAELSSFIGREKELAEVKALLQKARLVTLTGPGGTGKTRLAVRVARDSAGQYADDVSFVSLVATSDPVLVPNAVAQVLGVVEQPSTPLVDSLQRYFANKQLLLILDNFEHLLNGAPMVTKLLAAAPRLTILVTSREVLRLSGEYEYLVPPLRVPDPASSGSASDLSAYESVVQRLDHFGLLNNRSIIVHGIYITRQDRHTLLTR